MWERRSLRRFDPKTPRLRAWLREDQASDGAGEALARARLLSEAMRRLAANIDRTRTVVLFGNRLAHESADDDDARTPGGRALRFYSSIRLALQRGSLVQDALGVVGITIKVTTAKNKVAPPLRKCELRLLYGQGFTGERQGKPAASAAERPTH